MMRERERERKRYVCAKQCRSVNNDKDTRCIYIYIYMESWRVQHHKHLMSSESSDWSSPKAWATLEAQVCPKMGYTPKLPCLWRNWTKIGEQYVPNHEILGFSMFSQRLSPFVVTNMSAPSMASLASWALHIGQALHSEGDFFQRHIQLRSLKFDLCKSLNLSKNGRFMIIRFYISKFFQMQNSMSASPWKDQHWKAKTSFVAMVCHGHDINSSQSILGILVSSVESLS